MTYDPSCPVCNPPTAVTRRKVERLSVSVPAALVKFVRDKARADKTTVSKIVADALRHHRHTTT